MDFKRKEGTIAIIGAGPAGLAAAHRLSLRGAACVVLEKDGCIGGLSRTVESGGYRVDLGGHRFYTKNAEVSAWWRALLNEDLLSVQRRSRIYYGGSYYEYPLSLADILSHLGPAEAAGILLSYLGSRFCRLRTDDFEQWTVKRFGRKLYRMFFDEYTRKVWGMAGKHLSADMAGQRIRGMSLSAAIASALNRPCGVKSLIREFSYPRLGCGMMYEAAARGVEAMGGRVLLNSEVTGLRHDGMRVLAVTYRDAEGNCREMAVSHVCSSMPLTLLVKLLGAGPEVLAHAAELMYRSMVLVCVVVGRRVTGENWIYVQEPGMAVARIQDFGNWSAAMVPGDGTSCLGMEYFCDRGDAVWRSPEGELAGRAMKELETLGLCGARELVRSFVVRVPDAYPVYRLGYGGHLAALRKYVSRFENLYCMGRNGMFHYDSMDHAILTGLRAADNVLGGHFDLWGVEPEGGRYA